MPANVSGRLILFQSIPDGCWKWAFMYDIKHQSYNFKCTFSKVPALSRHAIWNNNLILLIKRSKVYVKWGNVIILCQKLHFPAFWFRNFVTRRYHRRIHFVYAQTLFIDAPGTKVNNTTWKVQLLTFSRKKIEVCCWIWHFYKPVWMENY